MPRFHEVYRDNVLMPDFRFAKQHLGTHFLQAMLAHVKTVRRLEDDFVKAHQADIADLEQALLDLMQSPLPDYHTEIPDLYFAFNQQLEARLGQGTVSFLRLGLSRNDLDMTVYKMRTRELLLTIYSRLAALYQAIISQAEAHLETIFIAQTHHQPGQPSTLAHYLCAIAEVVLRHIQRVQEGYQRLNTCPLGSAALAGSSYGLDRHFTAQLLAFDTPVANTYEAVASSDWQVEFVNVLQSTALSLSRFICDLLSWASEGLYVLADGLVQGSSIMPQKRNPVALEHARTHFSRTLGSSQMVYFSSHNIPYADLNDFGPDIQGALSALFIQMEGGLALLTICLEQGHFDREKLAELAQASNTTATELADELTRRCDLSFQEAHRLAGALVHHLAKQDRDLQEATPQDLTAIGGPLLEASVLHETLDPLCFVRRRSVYGGPAPEQVKTHLQRLKGVSENIHEHISQLNSKHQQAQQNLLAPRKEVR